MIACDGTLVKIFAGARGHTPAGEEKFDGRRLRLR
jgi:hypothetical protein